MYDVKADDIPRDFLLAWQQMVLPFEHGGHGLRRWQQHMQTGLDDEAGQSHFQVLQVVLQKAQRVARGTFDGSETQLAKDLCRAWQCNIETTRRAGGGDLAVTFLAFGYMVSQMTSEYDGLFYSERRSVDLGTPYLNSSVLQTITYLGIVVFF